MFDDIVRASSDSGNVSRDSQEVQKPFQDVTFPDGGIYLTINVKNACHSA